MKSTLMLLILLLVPTASALQWSEIMFNPAGADASKEFVELAGNESLVGCTIRDFHGGSRLNILQQGTNGIILIITNPSSVVYDTNATIYTVGKSIITDLPNTAETLNITCNTTLITTSYNTSLLSDFSEGESIIFQNEHWIVGLMNGTPGSRNIEAETAQSPVNNISPNIVPCNVSLVMTLSATHGIVGDHIGFTIISDSLASYEASSNGTVFDSGDTLTTMEHAIILPNTTQVKLAAYAGACKGKQRATRIIAVEQPKVEEQTEQTPVATVVSNPVLAPKAEKVVPITGAATTNTVVMDQDRSMVPWIALFGCVTIVASTVVFLQLLRREQH